MHFCIFNTHMIFYANESITFLGYAHVYFGEIFMLFLFNFLHLLDIGGNPGIPFNKCLLIVHNVFVGRLLKPIDGDISEMMIFNALDKLKFFFKYIFLFNRNVITHSIIIYNPFTIAHPI